MATKKTQPDQVQQQTQTDAEQAQAVDYDDMTLPELEAHYEHTYGNSPPLAGDTSQEEARRQIIDSLKSEQPIEPGQ